MGLAFAASWDVFGVGGSRWTSGICEVGGGGGGMSFEVDGPASTIAGSSDAGPSTFIASSADANPSTATAGVSLDAGGTDTGPSTSISSATSGSLS